MNIHQKTRKTQATRSISFKMSKVFHCTLHATLNQGYLRFKFYFYLKLNLDIENEFGDGTSKRTKYITMLLVNKNFITRGLLIITF